MKIAIIGTRGIPNHYGGFEQLAEYLSVSLSDDGYDVTVYNSSLHSYQESTFHNVKLVHCFDPTDKLGTIGQFVYDLNCILHCRKQAYDIILQLGYTSSSVWSFLFPKSVKIITNMDGLEWKRSKYGSLTKLFLKHAEKWAVKYSNVLIADSKGIQNHLNKTYKKDAVYIPYGATIFDKSDEKALTKFGLTAYGYYLVIARIEPENNIETIIKGYIEAKVSKPLVIIGSTKTSFGKYLKQTYTSSSVLFFESIYDIELLNQLRFHSLIYFHGHSVGGTNPSLLEAMASGAFICAHKNEFNEYVLENDAYYFSNDKEVCDIIRQSVSTDQKIIMQRNNSNKIKTLYTWKNISDAYIKVFQEA
jgi:glycosyltransferase involved in cell wall biosynthesis